MATRKVVLTGIAEWAKVFEEIETKGFEGDTRSLMVLALLT